MKSLTRTYLMLTKVVLIIALCWITPSWAGGFTGGPLTVTGVRVDGTGKAIVTFASQLTGQPTCATSSAVSQSQLAFTASSSGILSLVIAAKTSGLKISASGTGSCSIYPGIETWNSGTLAD